MEKWCNSWSFTDCSSTPLLKKHSRQSFLGLRALRGLWKNNINTLRLTGDVWHVNMTLRTTGSSKLKLNDTVLWHYPLIISYCVLKPRFWQLLTALWMILPDVWRSVGCGKRTVSLRRGARTEAGVAAAVELRMGSKKSFLLSKRQTVWSIFTQTHLTCGLSLLLSTPLFGVSPLNQLESTTFNMRNSFIADGCFPLIE